MNAPGPSESSESQESSEPQESRPKRGLRRIPVGIWLFIALGVIIGAGFALFSLASLWNGSSGPDTSTIVLLLMPPR